jgi:hypothetical protein
MPAVCFICLETSPPPIRMGCACRGDTGLAHIGCLVRAAESQATHRGLEGWWECRTCKQSFTGAVQRGLAEELWSRVRDQRTESEDRLDAANILAIALSAQCKYVEAEQMRREILEVQRRVLGPEHPETLASTGHLAVSLSSQGKHDEAERMQRELLEVRRRVLGAEHLDTLGSRASRHAVDKG